MYSTEEIFKRLNRSRFRSSFHLNADDISYCKERGSQTIEEHATAFINEKIKPAFPKNDGKQTPTKGHPVFKAMHACACCCRGCLNKWYQVPKGVDLPEQDCERIVSLLMSWISKELTGRDS